MTLTQSWESYTIWCHVTSNQLSWKMLPNMSCHHHHFNVNDEDSQPPELTKSKMFSLKFLNWRLQCRKSGPVRPLYPTAIKSVSYVTTLHIGKSTCISSKINEFENAKNWKYLWIKYSGSWQGRGQIFFIFVKIDLSSFKALLRTLSSTGFSWAIDKVSLT